MSSNTKLIEAVTGLRTLSRNDFLQDLSYSIELHSLGDVSEPSFSSETWLDDPLFVDQWHLDNPITGIDINVISVWEDYDGGGVTIGIWDDGVEYDHPDLKENYDPTLHIPQSDGGPTHDPDPENVNSKHGTAVAGIIAAVDNDIGVVGVAHGANTAGVDMFEDPTLDFLYSFQHLSDFDVTNHSWGFTTPYDANISSDDPFWLAFFDGFQQSVIEGRDGLGTINVKSAGNSRSGFDSFGNNLGPYRDANDSNFNTMSETITVGAVGWDGFVSGYSTPGASLLISAPSSDGSDQPGIWTTDRVGESGYSISNDPWETAFGNLDLDYTARFGGTSAAAPIVSGVVALMLEANPDLGWRDVQEILSMSARHVGSDIGDGPSFDELHAWSFNGDTHWNGGGRHFSNDYGFGLVDAHAAVRLAETWTEQSVSSNWQVETGAVWEGATEIPDADSEGVSFSLYVESDIELEMVSLRLDMFSDESFSSSVLRDIRIMLTSPDGTESQVLTENRFINYVTEPIWVTTSNAFRGEAASGEWVVTVSDVFENYVNTLELLELTLMGDAPTEDDTYIFTNEFGVVSGGEWGHSAKIEDKNGGTDAINAAAVTSDTVIDLAGRKESEIDGVEVSGFKGIENVFAGDGNDEIYGGNGKNWLIGGRGDDHLYGQNGKDTLEGGDGDDHLYGGNGNDTIHDGAGKDEMYGGRGADTFVLSFDGDDDWIFDFKSNLDMLVFESITFDDLSWEIDENDKDVLRFDIVDGESTDTLFMAGLGMSDIGVDDFSFV